jgi:predicted component of type VI protein secretion system
MTMKKLMAATTALALLSATATYADETAPSMPVEIVSQDAVNTGADGGVLVPILAMIFMLMVASGNSLNPV